LNLRTALLDVLAIAYLVCGNSQKHFGRRERILKVLKVESQMCRSLGAARTTEEQTRQFWRCGHDSSSAAKGANQREIVWHTEVDRMSFVHGRSHHPSLR